MKIGVLSDIHGNYAALGRCVDYALEHGCDRFILLGDYLGELAYPQRTMEYLYALAQKYPCEFVRGNKEDYWINHADGDGNEWRDGDSTTGALLYTYSRLTKEDMAFYRSLPIAKRLEYENLPPVTICHGSPFKTNCKLLTGDPKTYELLEKNDTDIILCGHTHYQGKIVHKGRLILNGGSVGVPLGSGGKTQFLILEGIEEENRWQDEFVTLEYDSARTVRELYEERLFEHAPAWTLCSEKMLSDGKNAHGTVLARAMELCREKEGRCVWPSVPEKYWEQAVKELLCE